MALRLAVITDIHYGIDVGAKKGTQALPLIDQFLAEAQNFNADYVINLGDEISTRAPELDDSFKATLRQHFTRAACPVLKVDGNHCVRFQEKQTPSRSFDTHGHHIVLWNPYMNRYTGEGVIPDAQDVDWLNDDLLMTDLPTIILSHIPFRGPDSATKHYNPKIENQYYPSHFVNEAKLQDIVEDSGKVILCLSGHRHLDHVQKQGRVHHIIQQSLVEADPQGTPSGAFNLIDITDSAITITAHGHNRKMPAILPLTPQTSPKPF